MITAEGLTKRFGSVLAVEDVSFEVHPGQVVGFLGHNGAGKTTTLKMILGHVSPTAGHSTILGRPYVEMARPLHHVGVLFESGRHPGRTARNHLRVSAAVGGLPTDRIDYLLGLVGLGGDADRRVGGFSHGMRQRLGIATALLGDPEVLIFDEPATGLDPEGIRWLRTLLRRLADGGRTVLVSSHQLAEVAQTVDHVLVIDRGRLVAQSSLEELVRRAGSSVLVRSPAAETLAEELRNAGIEIGKVSGNEVRAKNVPARVVGELATVSGVPVWELRTETPSLEEAFFELTSGLGGETPTAPAPAETAGQDAATAETEDQAAGDELALDRDLKRLPVAPGLRVVGVVAPAAGLGRTTLSFLLGDLLTTGLGARVLCVALSCDRERFVLPVPVEQRSSLRLTDLLEDLPEFDEAARISPYVSAARSGLHTLCGPRRREQLRSIRPEQIEELLAFAGRFYEIVVLDIGNLSDATLRSVLRRSDEVVLIGAPDAPDRLNAESPLLDALEAERSERATLVFNRVETGRVETFVGGPRQGPRALVPRDRELIRALDAGDYSIDQVRPSTRLALKRLALVVAEGL